MRDGWAPSERRTKCYDSELRYTWHFVRSPEAVGACSVAHPVRGIVRVALPPAGERVCMKCRVKFLPRDFDETRGA